jgi:hypothetical protein
MILSGENRRTRRITCPSTTLSTTNPTWIDPGAKPGLRGERSATNDLGHGTDFCVEKYYRLLQQNLCRSKNVYSFLTIKLNVKTYSWQLKPDSCKTHQHNTDRLTPDSTISPIVDSDRPYHSPAVALFAFPTTRIAHASRQA